MMGLSAAILLLALGCGGDEASADGQEGNGATIVAAADSAPAHLVDASWPVQMATQEAFKPYTGAGWVSLLMKRDYERAAGQFSPDDAEGQARIHREIASVYRQAALLSGNALIQTYAKTPEDSDPVGTAHLLTVAYAITGDLDQARAQSKKLGATDDPTQQWHAPWRTWLMGEAAWPPDLSGLPFDLPPPTAGQTPTIGDLPHYELPELGGGTTARKMADPGALVRLALWHDEAAGSPSHYRSAYRLPVEPAPALGAEMGMSQLFGSDLLVSGDAAYMAAVYGDLGPAAADSFKDKSIIAWLAGACRVDGKIDVERAVDLIAALRTQLVDAAKAKTDHTVQGHQRIFADVGQVGMLRNLALVAEKEGDREASGRLRITAMELSEKATACPVGLLALGAWDASNRYPSRAQDILHTQARRFPSLEAARYGLDVMALRVSRERPGETPGM